MNTTTHTQGISMEIKHVGTDCYLEMKATGTLTHEDYQTITPMIESCLSGVTGPKIKVLFDATEFEGWQLRAAWDDFKIGLKHGNEFEKVAIYGSKKWQEYAAKIGSWFISGEVNFFDNAEAAEQWILE